MSEKLNKLGEVAEVVDSLHKTPKYSDTGKAMVRCTDVKYGRLQLGNTFKVDDGVFKEFSRRYKPGFNDIIITRVGSYGITALVDDTDFCLGQNTAAIIPGTINARYLYLVLNSPFVKNQIEFSVVGSTQKTLSLKAINNIDIPRFGEEIEDAIAKIIGELDDKIQLNCQINHTLEDIAQAIFKSWFVDFEPTRAKIAAKQRWQALHGVVETSSPTCYGENDDAAKPNIQSLDDAMNQAAMAAISGLSRTDAAGAPLEELQQLSPEQLQHLQNIAALFPDALVASALGEIPEGWEVVGFKDIVKKYIDNRGKTPPIAESGIPLLEVKHLPEGSIKPNLNTSKYVDEKTFDSWFRAHLETDDIMISTVGTIGRICMVPEGEKIAIAQNLLGMRFKREKVSPYFMYYQMDGFRFRHDVDARLVITVQASIKRKDLETIDLLSPPVTLQNLFEEFVRPFAAMQQSNQEIELEEIRDTLLPKLLSGELAINPTQTELEKTA